jgi:hypothetical protein
MAGLVKKVLHGLIRRDVSAMPRPLDLWLGRLVVRCKHPDEPDLGQPQYRYREALPQMLE